MTDLNHVGADEARAIRDHARQLAEIDNLRDTSSLREVLLDLSHALADLAGPIRALTDAWVAQSDGIEPPDGDLPDANVLVILAADVRQLADNA